MSSLTTQPSPAASRGVPVNARVLIAGALVLAAIAIELLVHLAGGPGASAQIVRTAVCDSDKTLNCNRAVLGGLSAAADGIISPALVALIAVCPIACLIGAGAIMFGHRRGVIIVGSALGALVLAGAVKGIVA